MRAQRQSNSLSRRQFMRQGAAAAGFLGAAVAGVGAADRATNPFAYDVSRLMKTNPSLVHYQQARQIPSPRPNPRRLAIGPVDRLCLAAGI